MSGRRQCRYGLPRIRVGLLFKRGIGTKIRRELPYRNKSRQPKLLILARHVKLRNKLFLSFQKPLFSCVGATPTVNVLAVSTSVCLRFPAVKFFATVCRVKTQPTAIATRCVRFSEQNRSQRLIATDQFCKPLAVSSCLDESPSSRDQGLLSKCCLLLMSSPQSSLQELDCGNFFCQPRAAQGFVGARGL